MEFFPNGVMLLSNALTLTEMYGFSPECFLKCVFKCTLCERALKHWLQEKGLSPECALKCFFKVPPSGNSLGHSMQGNGFSP